jgi:DNA topoisomerase-1
VERFGERYVPEKPRVYRSGKAAQDAHEAIRPTDVRRTPESVAKYLTRDQLRLYELVWRRFLASQMSPAVYETTVVVARAGDWELKASGRRLRFAGFLEVYPEEEGEERELPALREGQVLELVEVEGTQHFTEPPPRYTEASLIKELEEKGIGRPSTYATILSIIQERDYVVKQGMSLVPTTLGRTVWKLLERYFPTVFDTEFTARMEAELDRVERGEDSWQEVVREFYEPFAVSLQKVQKRTKDIKLELQEETDRVCEKCGRKLVKKWGRHGQFLACPAFPECRYTRPLEEEPATPLDGSCPRCGGKLVLRTGRYGRFAACERYPECKHTEPLPIGMDCPREGCDGQVVEKRSRRGKIFYGCSRYPECDFATWYKPVDAVCPSCGNPYMEERESRTDGPFLRCPVCKERVSLE